MSDLIDTAFSNDKDLFTLEKQVVTKKVFLKQRLPDIINSFIKEETKTTLQLSTFPDCLILSCNIPSINHIKAALQIEISFHKEQIITKALVTCNNMFQTVKTKTLILKLLAEIMILNGSLNGEVISIQKENGLLQIKQIIQDNIIRHYGANKFIQSMKSRPLRMTEVVKDIFVPLHAFANQMPKKLGFEENKEKWEDILKNINMSEMELNCIDEEDMPVKKLRKGIEKIKAFQQSSQDNLHQWSSNLYTKQNLNCSIFRKKHFLSEFDQKFLGKHLLNQPLFSSPHENKYLYNEIILKDEKKIPEGNPIRGGTSELYPIKISCAYREEKNSKNALNLNKNPYFWKFLFYKLPRHNIDQYIQNLDNEKKIIQTIFSDSSSVYFPRFYQTKQECKIKNKLLIEYTPGDSNMNVYMNSFHKSISFKTKLIIFTRFMNGVNFLSHKQVVHMDLKPGNVLVGGGLRVKIIDFGSAYNPWLSKQNFTPALTHPYGAPECYLKNKDFTAKTDIFSAGMMLFEVFFDRLLFPPIEKFKGDYCYKRYLKSLFLAPENMAYCGNQKIMLLIYRLGLKCLEPQIENRPFCSWCCIVLKTLYDLAEELHR